MKRLHCNGLESAPKVGHISEMHWILRLSRFVSLWGNQCFPPNALEYFFKAQLKRGKAVM